MSGKCLTRSQGLSSLLSWSLEGGRVSNEVGKCLMVFF